jgi:hypothetical protein
LLEGQLAAMRAVTGSDDAANAPFTTADSPIVAPSLAVLAQNDNADAGSSAIEMSDRLMRMTHDMSMFSTHREAYSREFLRGDGLLG